MEKYHETHVIRHSCICATKTSVINIRANIWQHEIILWL